MVLGLAACGNTADTAQTPAAEEKTAVGAGARLGHHLTGGRSMKRLFPLLLAGLCAAASLLSCQKDINAEAPASEEMTIAFAATPVETRAAFTAPEGNSYPVVWTANDTKAKVSLNFAKEVDATIEPAADGKTARFVAKISAPNPAPADYTFYLISPASVLNGNPSFNASNKRATIVIPSVQTPLVASPDEAAMILAGQSAKLSALAETVPVSFKHVTAYGKLSFQNLNLDGAKVLAVELSSEVDLAGKYYYFPETQAASVVSGGGYKVLTLSTSATENIWFASAPVDLSGKKLSVAVKTDKGTFKKDVTLPADRKLESGKIASFTVDMQGVTVEQPKVYELVTKAEDLWVSSQVVIAAASSDYSYAISTTQASNNRAQAGVVKSEGKIMDPAADVEVFTVEVGSEAGTFSFKGQDGKYIYAAKGGNYLKSQTAKDAVASWALSFQDGYVIMESKTTENQRFLRYNAASSCFSCYATTSSVRDSVAIYKLAGSGINPELTDPELTLENTSLDIKVGSSAEIGIEKCLSTGKITYTSSDPAIATVDEDGMVLGVAIGTCKVTVSVAATGSYSAASQICAVTVHGASSTIAELLDKTTGKLDVSKNETIEASCELGQSMVVAISGGNVILKDETGVIMMYQSNHGLALGDVVTVTADLKNYYGTPELSNAKIVKVTTGTPAHGTATLLDEAAIAAYSNNRQTFYAVVEGKLPTTPSSSLVSVGTCQVNMYDKAAFADYLGRKAKVYGYTIGQNSNGQINFINISLEVLNLPFLLVDATSHTWEADKTDAFTVNVTVEDGGAWTFSATGMDWEPALFAG